jgi:c-di-GMP-binding flagellar brake protein YcgR
MEKEKSKGEHSLIALPRIGQTLRMSPAGSNDDPNRQTYRTRIADIHGDLAAIELPLNEKTGRTGSLTAGVAYDVWYLGEDGSRYDFRTLVVGKRADNIPLLLIQMPSKDKVTRTQRRNYLRVNMQAEIAVRLEDRLRNYHFLARTIDVSGGGLSFTCPEEYRLKQQDQLRIWLCLPSKTGAIAHAFAVSEVIRCKPPEQPGDQQSVFVKFIQVNEADRAKIVRACYERQLEMRKKSV